MPPNCEKPPACKCARLEWFRSFAAGAQPVSTNRQAVPEANATTPVNCRQQRQSVWHRWRFGSGRGILFGFGQFQLELRNPIGLLPQLRRLLLLMSSLPSYKLSQFVNENIPTVHARTVAKMLTSCSRNISLGNGYEFVISPPFERAVILIEIDSIVIATNHRRWPD